MQYNIWLKMDKLIFGKSGFKGIVGVEVTDDQAEIFQQDSHGKVTSIFVPNRFWILSSDNITGKCKKLDGNLYYQWGTQFKTRREFEEKRNRWKHNTDIYSVYNAEEALLIKDGYSFYQGLQPKDISVLSFDLETTGLDGNAPDAKIVLISTTYRDKNTFTNRLFQYDEYDDEKEMIEDFCAYVVALNPSLIVNHNILAFDFPYLRDRAKTLKTKLLLGRDGSEIKFNSYKSKFRIDGTRTQEYHGVTIYGREIVDTYFLAVSFDVSKSIETYALKPMIKQLGLEKEGRQYYDAGSIRENYKIPAEWEKIKQYAVEDAEDAIKLWDMMGPLYFHLAPNIPKPFSEILLSASGSKINSMLVRAYLQDGHSIPRPDIMQKFEGAISFANPGIYKNCFKIDLEALYPSIMLEYEVYDVDKDPKAYLIQLVKIFREKRLEYKRLAAETGDPLWQEMDTTAKSVLNSFYGFLGASGLPFNSLECAAFITKIGRETLLYTIKYFSSMTDEQIEEMTKKDYEGEEDDVA